MSNDNAYSESLFRTTKYRPDYPLKGFECLEEAQAWVLGFVRWYNLEHRHSGIKFVTPEQRHTGVDIEILAQREAFTGVRGKRSQSAGVAAHATGHT